MFSNLKNVLPEMSSVIWIWNLEVQVWFGALKTSLWWFIFDTDGCSVVSDFITTMRLVLTHVATQSHWWRINTSFLLYWPSGFGTGTYSQTIHSQIWRIHHLIWSQQLNADGQNFYGETVQLFLVSASEVTWNISQNPVFCFWLPDKALCQYLIKHSSKSN